jgi:TonB family protein
MVHVRVIDGQPLDSSRSHRSALNTSMREVFAPVCPVMVALLFGLSILVRPTSAETNPAFRPALIGNGPNSLVNLIDTEKLLREGQQDAVVMFSTFPPGGHLFGDAAILYNTSPNSRLLQKEVLDALAKARMIPAIQNQKQVLVSFDGTVMFFAKATPHLRVFANQEPNELAHFADFIAPQLVFASDSWDSKTPLLDAARRLGKNGTVVLLIHVDDKGHMVDVKVASEDPPGFNFGAAMLKSFSSAQFIPAFRNGKPTGATFHLTKFIITRPYPNSRP